MLEKQLIQLGFHKNEIIVYLELLELGKCKAGDIIKNAKLHRNLVYTALETLEEKRLISKIQKGKVAVFEINSPDIIKNLVEEKMDIANELVKELNKKLSGTPRNIQVFEGNEGIMKTRENFARNIQKNESYRVMGVSYSKSNPEITDYFAKFNKYILKKGADFKVLVAGNEDKKIIADSGLTWQTNARYLPFSINSPMWMALFRDTLNISIVGDDPVTFSIQSKDAAEGFRKYFDYFWNNNTTTLRGETGAKIFMEDQLNYSDVYWIGGNGGVEKYYPKVWDDYKKQRVAKKVFWHDLIDPDMKLSSTIPGKTIFDEDYYEYKFLPQSVAGPHVICIYGNKVANILWQEDSVINIIEDEKIAESYKKYFNYLWNQETQVLRGGEALRDLWLKGVDCKEMRWIGAKGFFIDRYPEMFKEIEAKVAKTPGVIWKNVVDPSMKDHTLTRLPYVKTKFHLSPNKNPTVVWLFGDTVLVTNWAENEPIIFQSTNKYLVQSYNTYFEELWNKK